MNAEKYLQQLGSQLGLEYVGKRKPFEADPMVTVNYKGTIMGSRRGFVLALSLLSLGNQTMLAILIRYPQIADPKPLEDALKAAVGIKKLTISKRVKVKDASAEIQWQYSIKKPSADEVMPLVDQLLAAVATYAPTFDGKCEDCHSASTPEITLHNDVPGYHCASCQSRVAGERQLEAEAYSQRPTDFFIGYLWAILTALGGAAAMTGLYYVLDDKGSLPLKLWFALPVGLGMAVGYVFSKKVGRIDVKSQALPLFVLVLLAAWAADTAYVTWYVAATDHLVVTQDLVLRLNKYMWDYRLHGEGLVVMAGELIGAGLSVYVVNKMRPKFDAAFVTLSTAAVNRFAASA